MDGLKYKKLHELSKEAGVGYTIVFQDANQLFYVRINSTAPSEEYCTRDTDIDSALDWAIEWINQNVIKR